MVTRIAADREGGACGLACGGTNKRAMELLTKSVCDTMVEASPFRAMHHSLLQSRLAARRAHGGSTSGSSGGSSGGSSSSTCTSPKEKPSPLQTALQKIQHHSEVYKRGRDNLAGFQGRPLGAQELRDQLWRSLGLRLTTEEADAVVKDREHFFDRNGDGCIDGAEFLAAYFGLGQSARGRAVAARARRVEAARLAPRRRDAAAAAARAAADKALLRLAPPVGGDGNAAAAADADAARAQDALAHAALSLACSRGDAAAVARRAFQCQMGPVAFREQLLRSFGLRLPDREAAALFRRFDVNGSGHVDGAEFLREMGLLTAEARQKEREEHKYTAAVRKRACGGEGLLHPLSLPYLGRG